MSDVEEKKKKSMEVEAVVDAELEKYHNILGFKVKRVRGKGQLRILLYLFSPFFP